MSPFRFIYPMTWYLFYIKLNGANKVTEKTFVAKEVIKAVAEIVFIEW